MHEKSWTIDDPIEKLANFVEIQDEDDRLDAMDEVNKVTKTILWKF